MIAQQTYAQIYNGEIKAVCNAENYEDANRVARCVYGDDAIAVYCNQYLCKEGDKYIDGVFYEADGVTPIEYIPTQEQEIAQLQAENKQLRRETQELTLALADIIGGAAV